MRKMMRKRRPVLCLLLALAAVVPLLGSLAGCSTEVVYDKEYDRNGNVIVKVWSAYPLYPKYKSYYNQPTSAYYGVSKFTKEVVDEFQSANPGYVIQLLDMGWGEELNSKIQSASISNTLPDVLAGETYVNKYISLDILQPLEVAAELRADIVDGTFQNCVAGDKVYALPVMTGDFSLYYNQKVLEDAGVTELPTTWEGVLAAAQKVHERGKDGFLVCNAANLANAFRAQVLMAAAGGDFLATDGSLALNSEANLKAFTMINALSKTAADGISSKPQDDLKTYFFNGSAAFMIEGTQYFANAAAEELNNEKNNIGVAPLPVFADVNRRANVVSGNLMFSVVKYSPNKEIAQKFIEYLMSAEIQTKAFLADGRIPTRRSVIEAVRTATEENTAAQYGRLSVFIDSIERDELTTLPGFLNNSSNIWDKFNGMMGTVVSTRTTTPAQIKQALDDAQNYIKGKL